MTYGMLRDRILSLLDIGTEELASEGSLLSAADGFFTATYPDPATGAARSATFCATARSMGAMRLDGQNAVWTNVQMEWTER